MAQDAVLGRILNSFGAVTSLIYLLQVSLRWPDASTCRASLQILEYLVPFLFLIPE